MPGAVQTMFRALGTVNSITVYDTAQRRAADGARSFVWGLDRLLSVFRPDSELSRFNALGGGEWMEVSGDTCAIIRESIRCSAMTNGAFDVTAGPLSTLWREAIRTRQLPSAEEIRCAKQLVDYRDLKLDEAHKRICLRKREQRVDFGGIAKGYAADKVTGQLRCAGVRDAVIDFGGTVGVLGRPRRIGIQDPCRPAGEPVGTLTLQNAFAVTSGGYERGFTQNGIRWHHILDPRSGMPSAAGLLSVTLVGDCAAELDALATAVFVLGAEAAIPLLQKQGIEAIFITGNGRVLVTPGLQSTFQFVQQKGA